MLRTSTVRPDPVDVARLAARVDALERRVRALEEGAPARVGPARRGSSDDAPVPLVSEGFTAAEVAALVGRIALGLGGAFLLRSATQAGILAPRLGVVLGLVYALAWLAVADRAAARRRVHGAVTDGVLAALIGLPLVWEATARFGLLAPAGAMTALAAIVAAFLAVGLRRRQPALVWPLVLGIVPVVWALALAAKVFAPWLAFLVAVSAVLAAIARRRPRWRPLDLTAMALLHLSLLAAVGAALVARPGVQERALVPWQLVGILTASFVLRVLPTSLRAARLRGRIRARELAEAGVAAVVGIGGALAVAHHAQASAALPGGAALALGAAAYLSAFRRFAAGRGRSRTIPALASAGLVLALVGLIELLDRGGTAVAIALLAAATTALALARRGSPVAGWLCTGAAILGLTALIASGTVLSAVRLLFGIGVPAVPFGVAQVAAMAAAAACCAACPVLPGRGLTLLRGTLLAAVAASLGGLAIALVAALLPAPSPSVLAPLRTAVIAAAAMALAASARFRPLREGQALVYPLLVAGGLKVVFDELRIGDPTVLVASLTLYGTALLVAPRLGPRRG